MVCNNCGFNNNNENDFCGKCGKPIEKVVVSEPTPKKDNSAKIIIIVLIAVGVLVVLPIVSVIVFWFAWPSIRGNINEQWESISTEENTGNKEEIKPSTPKKKINLEKTIDGKVVIYFFRGEGCSHCAEAEAWFESIKEEYGKYFIIKDYETWYDSKNAELMQEVAESRGEEAYGVPYIIIGDKSWNGFSSVYEDDMLSEIKRAYELY